MTLKEYKTITEIKSLWDEIYTNNKYMSFFQSYDWMVLVERRFKGRRFLKYPGFCIRYLVINERFIAPIVINKYNKQIELLGEDSSSDYLSPLFFEEDYGHLDMYFVTLFKHYNGFSFKIVRINQNNPVNESLRKVVAELGYTTKIKEDTCVAINIQNGEGSFLDNSSRNARHSYNQSVNRLIRDGHTYRCEFFYEKVDDGDAKAILNLYYAHRKNCSKKTGELPSKIHLLISFFRKKCLPQSNFDVLSEYSKIRPVWMAKIYIDDELAGFWEGDECNNQNTICMCRTAMNEKYYWYKPGTILMVDFIEHIKDHILYFDLTRGDEEYKFRYGGVAHSNISFLIDKSTEETKL